MEENNSLLCNIQTKQNTIFLQNTSGGFWPFSSDHFLIHITLRVSEPSQISKMDFFVKIYNGWKLLAIFKKISILGVWLGSENACDELFNNILFSCF